MRKILKRFRRHFYKIRIAQRQILAPFLSRQYRPSGNEPSVTVFIGSLNTLYPLRLTLETMLKHTRYPNFSVVIGENGSTDGTREYLESLDDPRIRVESRSTPQHHQQWLNWLARTCATDLWVAVDSDMYFFSQDWLAELIAPFATDPKLMLVSGEPNPEAPGFVEPVAAKVIDLGENPSTWLFAARTSLREHLSDDDLDFAFVTLNEKGSGGNPLCFDTGGLILRKLRALGFRDEIMPSQYRYKWYHFGSLSWSVGDAETEKNVLRRDRVAFIKSRLGIRA